MNRHFRSHPNLNKPSVQLRPSSPRFPHLPSPKPPPPATVGHLHLSFDSAARTGPSQPPPAPPVHLVQLRRQLLTEWPSSRPLGSHCRETNCIPSPGHRPHPGLSPEHPPPSPPRCPATRPSALDLASVAPLWCVVRRPLLPGCPLSPPVIPSVTFPCSSLGCPPGITGARGLLSSSRGPFSPPGIPPGGGRVTSLPPSPHQSRVVDK